MGIFEDHQHWTLQRQRFHLSNKRYQRPLSALLGGQIKRLIGQAQPADGFARAQAGSLQGNDFVEGHKTVSVEIRRSDHIRVNENIQPCSVRVMFARLLRKQLKRLGQRHIVEDDFGQNDLF